MNIDSPLRELGPIDNSELSDAIMSLDESVWKENLTRQEEFEVHRATESVVMYFVDLDQWPLIEINKIHYNRLGCSVDFELFLPSEVFFPYTLIQRHYGITQLTIIYRPKLS